MPQLRLTLKLIGGHTLHATAAADGHAAEMWVWRLTDAPGDLARAVVVLMDGADRAMCAWMDEPGEYRWVLARAGDRVTVLLLGFDSDFSKRPDQDGTVLLRTRCPLVRLATQVKGQLQQLLNEHGEQAYEQLWGHPFPRDRFERLKELILLQKHGPFPTPREPEWHP